jgi:hypothetical protein
VIDDDGSRQENGANRIERPGRRKLVAAAFGAFLVILGHRLVLVNAFGVNLPGDDQWQAEAGAVYLPWRLGVLSVHQLFEPCQEHHIVLTRLLGLSLIAVNGVWDVRLELLVNAMLYTGSWVLLALALGGSLRWPARVLLLAWGVLLSLPCFASSNALFAFQSQIYFVLLFQWSALWLLVTRPPLSRAWWAGLLPAGLAFLSFASGVGAAITAAGVAAFRAAVDARQRPRALTGALVLGAFSAGCIALTPRAHDMAPLRAETLGAFGIAFVKLLAWPFSDVPYLAPLVLAPWLALAIGWLRAPGSERSFPVALGAWIATQAGMVAYGRAGLEAFPASRYLDFVLPGLLLGPTCFAWLLRDARTAARPLVAAAFACWMAVVGFGLVRAIPIAARDRIWFTVGARTQWRYVHHFFRTDDDRVLLDAPPTAIPIEKEDAAYLRDLLRNPALVAILPASLTGERPARHAPLSAISEFMLARGAWFEGLGAVLLLALMAMTLPRKAGPQENAAPRPLTGES